MKFYNTNLGEAEIKKLFINTGRSLEGFYPLGEKIDNTDKLKILVEMDFMDNLRIKIKIMQQQLQQLKIMK